MIIAWGVSVHVQEIGVVKSDMNRTVRTAVCFDACTLHSVPHGPERTVVRTSRSAMVQSRPELTQNGPLPVRDVWGCRLWSTLTRQTTTGELGGRVRNIDCTPLTLSPFYFSIALTALLPTTEIEGAPVL
jgi:hypothetical protein